MQNKIEKQIELKAPVSRVWRALTDYREFGEWFRVAIEGPFEPGKPACGYITYPGYEHVIWQVVIQQMEPDRLFSFTWHPYAVDTQHRTTRMKRRPSSSFAWKRPQPARGSRSPSPASKMFRPIAAPRPSA